MNQKTKRLLLVATALVALLALSYVAFYRMGKNLVYYWDAKQLLDRAEEAQGATIRLGGVVQSGTLVWKAESNDLRFSVGMSPQGGPAVLVQSSGVPPQMFREGIGVVVEGEFDGRVFHCARLMVKHSNEYRAPAPGERPQEIYKTLVQDS